MMKRIRMLRLFLAITFRQTFNVNSDVFLYLVSKLMTLRWSAPLMI